MKIDVKEKDGVSTVTLEGEFDMGASAAVRDVLREAFDQKPKKVVVLLKEIQYIDSSGLAVLIEALRWSTKGKVGFALAEPSERVMRVLELARLEKGVFEILQRWETA